MDPANHRLEQLRSAERDAWERLVRLRGSVPDDAVIAAAELLWHEARQRLEARETEGHQHEVR